MWSHNKGAVGGKTSRLRHKFLLVTVKEWLKSVLNYRSYPKNKIGYPFSWNTLYVNHGSSSLQKDYLNYSA